MLEIPAGQQYKPVLRILEFSDGRRQDCRNDNRNVPTQGKGSRHKAFISSGSASNCIPTMRAKVHKAAGNFDNFVASAPVLLPTAPRPTSLQIVGPSQNRSGRKPLFDANPRSPIREYYIQVFVSPQPGVHKIKTV